MSYFKISKIKKFATTVCIKLLRLSEVYPVSQGNFTHWHLLGLSSCTKIKKEKTESRHFQQVTKKQTSKVTLVDYKIVLEYFSNSFLMLDKDITI